MSDPLSESARLLFYFFDQNQKLQSIFDFESFSTTLIGKMGNAEIVFVVLTLFFVYSLCFSVCMCLSLILYSLSTGIDSDVCCDAAVRDGPACPAIPGALHPDNLCCCSWVQKRDEAVLGGNHL